MSRSGVDNVHGVCVCVHGVCGHGMCGHGVCMIMVCVCMVCVCVCVDVPVFDAVCSVSQPTCGGQRPVCGNCSFPSTVCILGFELRSYGYQYRLLITDLVLLP